MSTTPAPLHRRRASGLSRVTLTGVAGLLIAAILVALLVDRIFYDSNTSAGTGSGVPATQARALPPFASVDLAGDNNVTIRVGTSQSVVVHADSNLLRRVTTQVRSGRLVIGNTPGNLNAKTPMFVAVNVPSLNALTLHGDGNISVAGINSRSLIVSLPGSGTVQATGAAARLDVTISGSGTAMLGELIARDVNSALSGEGTITLTATHSLRASISGSGAILYRGSPPSVIKEVTGSGAITGG